jgi:hypothetical protein
VSVALEYINVHGERRFVMSGVAPQKYHITMICKATLKTKDGDVSSELVRIEHTIGHFSCPRCNMHLAYIPETRKLGAHGKSAENLNHELRQVTELNAK